MAVAVSLLAFLATGAGGLLALRARRRLHLLLGLTAGILLGVVAFDLLPEVFAVAGQRRLGVPVVMLLFAGGFLTLHVVERTVAMHVGHESDYGEHRHPAVGVVSALSLAVHSFLDGIGIALGFAAGTTTGVAVTLAVLSHDVADGVNTVGVMLASRNTVRRSLALLALDAAAPVLGAATALSLRPSESVVGLYLGWFGGALLYIATGDILPEAHARRRSPLTLAMTVTGALAMWGVVAALS